MSISVESTKSKILVTIKGEGSYMLQRALYDKGAKWLSLTSNGFVDTTEQLAEFLFLQEGDFVDSFDLKDGIYEYRIVSSLIQNPTDTDYEYSEYVKFGTPSAIGYTFGNYSVPEGSWGSVVTPDDCRFTYLWGTDFKATNGQFFDDAQIQFFINEATRYMERMLNISIIKTRIKSQAEDRNLVKGVDYDEEESLYDFSPRKIQRYGMIQTKHRPIINVEKLELINRTGDKQDLLTSTVIDRKKGVLKFLSRPYKQSDTTIGINTALGRYGNETLRNHLFYAIDYSAGYENSDSVPSDLRQIIAKVAAISLLNIIGDGLMSGFSSSSLSMDGISESFSSTQSATSAYFGARIAVYQKEVETYIKDNKYRFGFLPIGAL